MSNRGSPISMSSDYSHGDDQFALNVVAGISSRIADLNMTDNEDLCKAALASNGSGNQLLPPDVHKHKKAERKGSEFFQKALTAQQAQNQLLRFGTGNGGIANPRSSWAFFNLNMDTRDADGRRDYEDVVDPEILNAPICDVCIVQAKTMPPPGFYRLHKTPTNKKADLNTASGGNPLYLCIKKDTSGTLYPITNFIVVFPDRNEYTPPGFAVVNRGKTACNLNSGTNAERIFLCYRKEAQGNPLIDIQVILPTKGETPPAAFNLIEKSISGIAANLNSGTGGADVYLTYRQKMTRLSVLLNEPVANEEETRSRLRSIRRHTMKSFDDVERGGVSAIGSLHGEGPGQGQGIASVGATAGSTPAELTPGRPLSGSMQPVAINTLTGQAASLRFRSVSMSNSAAATTPPPPRHSLTEANSAALGVANRSSPALNSFLNTGNAGVSSNSIHSSLPQSFIYSMPQSLPPNHPHRHLHGQGLVSALRSGQSPAGGTGSDKGSENGDNKGAPRPRSLNNIHGLSLQHNVSFGDSVVDGEDSPSTAAGSTHPFCEQDVSVLTPNGQKNDWTGTPQPLSHVGHLSHSVSFEGLEEGRDRASTSTTVTGQAATDINDNDSRAGKIDAERADSDMPLRTLDALITTSKANRRASYTEYDQPYEEYVLESEDAEYEEEMAYLLAQMQLNKRQEVVDSYGSVPPLVRRKALLAILSALYIRQGTVANAALAGLSDLLRDSKFFAMDLVRLPAPGSTTMIDLAVEAVCDRFELSADGERDSLLRFLGQITPYCGSKLSLQSLQRIFSAVAFLCCHYAITKPAQLEASLGSFSLDADNFEDYDGQDTGMPSFKLLSQLLTDTFKKIEAENIADHLPSVTDGDADDNSSVTSTSTGFPAGASSTATSTAKPFVVYTQAYTEVKEIVDDFVAEVLDSIEVARLSEVAFLTISKQTYSTISPPFWKEVTALSTTMFHGHGYRSAFLLLSAICKQAWHTVRTKNVGEPVARDVGVKLVALGALEQFCLLAGDSMCISKIFGYQIRRIVIPCLLYNVTYAFMDHRIFSKVLKIITALWKKWRRHVRIEFAILCEQFIFKVMQATVVQVKPIFKMIMIQEVTKWFEQPHLLLEMFVNYDMDRKFVSHWNTFSYLVRTFCAIGKRVLFSHPNTAQEASHTEGDAAENSVTIRDVHMQALEEVARMAKTLMDASGHAYLILQDSGFRIRSMGHDGGWVEDEDSSSTKSPMMQSGKTVGGTSSAGTSLKDGAELSPSNSVGDISTASAAEHSTTTKRRMGSIKMKREAHQESEALIKKAIEIYHTKNDLKKAVDYLIKNQFLANTPQEIANFLRLYKNSFDPGAIGEFLGEGGKNKAEEEYWSNIRFRYTRAVSFVEMDIEPALRLYLTGCGFRMPGEAQKINRFVEVFVKAFWQDNSGTANCPFKKEDTVHLLAYAIILLNTDLNNVNLDKKGKKRTRMSKEDFFKQLRGCDDGNDIDKDYLSRIYDNIAAQAIELVVKTPASKAADDSAAVSNPQYYTAAGVSHEMRLIEEKKFVREMCSSLRDSEDLLRSLSPFTFLFVETKISMDLVSFMYESVWFHFHAIAEALLSAASTDMFVKIAALDILSYSLTCSIFLDLKVERMTLAGLLNNYRIECESLPNVGHVKRSPKIPDNSWYEDVENAFPATALETISKLHHLFVYIKDILQESENYEKTRQVADKFEKKAKVLESNSFFVRQGDLAKLSKTKRATTYRFFLFSDQLIYAHASRDKYVIHEQLSLLDMQVSDVPTDPTMCSFFVEHPVKSFQVTAESPSAKQYWMRDIAQTIASCRKRQQVNSAAVAADPRRMSMIGRIESQKIVQQQEQESTKRVQERAYIYKGEGELSPLSPGTAVSSQRVSFTSQSVPFSTVGTPTTGADGNNTNNNKAQYRDSANLKQSAKESLLASDEEAEGGGRHSSGGSGSVLKKDKSSRPVSAPENGSSSSGVPVKHNLNSLFSSIDAEAEDGDRKNLLS